MKPAVEVGLEKEDGGEVSGHKREVICVKRHQGEGIGAIFAV